MPPSVVLYGILAVCVLSLVFTLVLLLRGSRQAEALARPLRDELRAARAEQAALGKGLREELGNASKAASDTQLRLIGELRESQLTQFEAFETRVATTLDGVGGSVEKLRDGVGQHLRELQEGNEKRLEEIRATVDEKLHQTLERRLGESFALVSDRLEAVQRGLGEMQSLANGVGDLKRVLSGVRTRGVLGEYQLGAILEEILTPDQYCANYRPSGERGQVVEFAIRLPGRDDAGSPIYLPIDAKFPQEDYHRLLDAADRADPDGVREAGVALGRAVRTSARDIAQKYIQPPETTDFAIMFLPTEGLYAEVLRQPGLVQEIGRQYGVMVAGPTTLAALLNSLRMGFRTLALQQRSGEIWRLLGAVKTEFTKFGDVLERLKKQLNTASRTIEESERRTRAMERKLEDVEELPPDLAREVVGLVGEGSAGEGDEEEGEPA